MEHRQCCLVLIFLALLLGAGCQQKNYADFSREEPPFYRQVASGAVEREVLKPQQPSSRTLNQSEESGRSNRRSVDSVRTGNFERRAERLPEVGGESSSAASASGSNALRRDLYNSRPATSLSESWTGRISTYEIRIRAICAADSEYELCWTDDNQRSSAMAAALRRSMGQDAQPIEGVSRYVVVEAPQELWSDGLRIIDPDDDPDSVLAVGARIVSLSGLVPREGNTLRALAIREPDGSTEGHLQAVLNNAQVEAVLVLKEGTRMYLNGIEFRLDRVEVGGSKANAQWTAYLISDQAFVRGTQWSAQLLDKDGDAIRFADAMGYPMASGTSRSLVAVRAEPAGAGTRVVIESNVREDQISALVLKRRMTERLEFTKLPLFP